MPFRLGLFHKTGFLVHNRHHDPDGSTPFFIGVHRVFIPRGVTAEDGTDVIDVTGLIGSATGEQKKN